MSLCLLLILTFLHGILCPTLYHTSRLNFTLVKIVGEDPIIGEEDYSSASNFQGHLFHNLTEHAPLVKKRLQASVKPSADFYVISI